MFCIVTRDFGSKSTPLYTPITFSSNEDCHKRHHIPIAEPTLVVNKYGYVKLSLSLTKYHVVKTYLFNQAPRRKTYRGVEAEIHVFLISELDGGERSASQAGSFNPRERDPVPN
jgi:hypothetical protein